MYTKCPSCRAELSFLPPPNPESLPEGYKHRIKCPHCGVTIGVKINKVDMQATYPNGYPPVAPQPNPTYPTQPQPQYAPQQPQTFAPKTNTKATEQEEEADDKPKNKTGRPRNVMVMILTLIFVLLTALPYALTQNLDKLPEFMRDAIPFFNGIKGWELLIKDFETFKVLFTSGEGIVGILTGVVSLFPMFIFTLSCISFILALLGLIFKKYVRIINLIFGILIGGMAVTMLFYPQIISSSIYAQMALLPENLIVTEECALKDYFQSKLSMEGILFFVSAGLGLIYFVFSILFMKAIKIKDEEEEE